MKGQFFVMATVIMIFTLIALIRYFYDFSDINLPKLKEISELNYIPYIKDSLNSTVASSLGDCYKLQNDLNATKIFLENEMIKRGINLNINYQIISCSPPDVSFNFTIKTSDLYTETVFATQFIPTIMRCDYPAFGDWDIFDDVVCSNQLIIINGNITIYNGGSLTFKNVALRLNSTHNLEYGIEVQDGGKMFIYDNDNRKDTINDASNITNGPYNTSAHYFFQVRDNSQFEMKNSFLNECGCYENISGWTNYAGLKIWADGSIVVNNTIDNSYRAIQIGANNCLVSGNTVKNSVNYGILIVNYVDMDQNNIISDNILIDNVHNIHTCNGAKNNTITRNNVTGGTYGIHVHSGSGGPASFNKYTYNNITSATYGIYIIQDSNNNLFANSSVTNSGTADYYVRDNTSTNEFMNMNWTEARKIYFYNSTPWFNYNSRTDIDLWLSTSVFSTATITRELTTWIQDSIQWNDTSSSTTTATYNITDLEPNTVYYVYNNSIFTYSLNSGTNGEISFTIDLPQNEEHEIKVEA